MNSWSMILSQYRWQLIANNTSKSAEFARALAVKTDECVVLVHERLSIVGLGTVIRTRSPTSAYDEADSGAQPLVSD